MYSHQVECASAAERQGACGPVVLYPCRTVHSLLIIRFYTQLQLACSAGLNCKTCASRTDLDEMHDAVLQQRAVLALSFDLPVATANFLHVFVDVSSNVFVLHCHWSYVPATLVYSELER